MYVLDAVLDDPCDAVLSLGQYDRQGRVGGGHDKVREVDRQLRLRTRIRIRVLDRVQR